MVFFAKDQIYFVSKDGSTKIGPFPANIYHSSQDPNLAALEKLPNNSWVAIVDWKNVFWDSYQTDQVDIGDSVQCSRWISPRTHEDMSLDIQVVEPFPSVIPCAMVCFVVPDLGQK